jgi:hypothetical protein
MSRIHLRSNTLLLWLTLSAAVAASAVSVGCSSSSDSGAEGGAGKAGGGLGGAAATAGSSSSEAGDPAVGGETGEGGGDDTPTAGTASTGTAGKAGTAGTGGSAAGGSTGGGEAGDPGEGGAAGSPDAADPRVAAAQARALVLISGLSTPRKCTTCHDVGYQGAGFFPNITPDVDTGIGSWDEEDIKLAISGGKNKDGEMLCATMERYAFTDEQLSDLAIFLKHLPPINKKISAKCPSP